MRIHLNIINFLVLLTLCAQAGHPQNMGERKNLYQGHKEQLHVYLLIGQSNMSGRGAINEEQKTFPENVFLLNKENLFEPATHPLNQYSTIGKAIEKQKLNIGYSFAKSMLEARSDISIGLIVNARGGSGIQHWEKGTDFYKEAIRRAEAAQEHGTLKGILWHQGERNSGHPDGYDKKLAQLIEDLRQDLGVDTLPFVAGQIVRKPRTEEINALIAELPDKVPNCGYVSSEGLNTFEPWHFDTAGIVKLGEGYAREMLRLEAK